MLRFDLDEYFKICKMSEDELHDYLFDFLLDKYSEELIEDKVKKYIYAEGDIPIMLTAHMDTVWDLPPFEIYTDTKENVVWSPQGGCGDDRLGIYLITLLVEEGYSPHILFTHGEEMYGAGAFDFIDNAERVLNLKYIIELDRCGKEDSVFYDCQNKEFEEYINSFGFKTNIGSFSDISIICPEFGVAGVNLSIGYYNEHSQSEIVRYDEALETCKKVKKMLDQADSAEFFEYLSGVYSFDSVLDEIYKVKTPCGAFCADSIRFLPSIIKEYELSELDLPAFFNNFCSACKDGGFN